VVDLVHRVRLLAEPPRDLLEVEILDVAEAEHLLFDPLRSAVRRSAIQAATDAVDLVPAQLGERAEVLGALALVLSDSHQFMLTASNRA